MKLDWIVPLFALASCSWNARVDAPPTSNVTAATTVERAAGQPISVAALAHERELLDQANAALAQEDPLAARELAARAVSELLARSESEQDEEWLTLLDAAASAAWDVHDAETASAACRRALEFRTRTLPADHRDLQRTRLRLAASIKALGDLQGARALEEQVLEIDARTLPDDHLDLQWARQSLAATIAQLGDLQGARALLEKALEVGSRTLPDEHLHLLKARGNLAGVLSALGDLNGARTLLEQMLEVGSRSLPDDHRDLQAVRSNLALTMKQLGDWRGARALQEKVLEVLSRTHPDDHPDVQVARLNLAISMHGAGDLRGARALEEQVLEIRLRTLPDEHPDLQPARLGLAATLKDLGDLHGARALEEHVHAVLTRTLPDDHLRRLNAQGNLAGTLYLLGDLHRAHALFETALESLARTLPDEHPELQRARQGLALTMEDLGDLHSACALEEKVLEVYLRTLPDEHPSVQHARQNLAVTLHRLGDSERARELQERVLDIRARTLPDEHPDVQYARENLGVTLQETGDLSGARALYEQVLDVRARTLPEEHPDLQKTRINLASVLAQQHELAGGTGDVERCAELVRDLCRAQALAARRVLLESAPREAQALCEQLARGLDTTLSFAGGLDSLAPMPELEREAFLLSETTRGAALGAAAFMRFASGAPTYARCRDELRSRSEELAALARSGMTSDEFHRAVERRESAERELAGLARDRSGGALPVLDFELGVLSRKIATGDAVVAYRKYARLSNERSAPDAAAIQPGGSRPAERLCAFVVRSAHDPWVGAGARAEFTFVELGPIEPIEAIVHRWRAGLGAGGEARGARAGSAAALSPDFGEAGRELRRRIVDPLVPALQGADRIVVVHDDVLHLVPLDALPADDSLGTQANGELLGDRLRIDTRITVAELLASAPETSTDGDLIAVGGVDYGDRGEVGGPDPAQAEHTAASFAEVRFAEGRFSTAGVLRGGPCSTGFSDLPATGIEAHSIARLFSERNGSGGGARLLEGEGATRDRLYDLVPRARWLHVATHGWFASESVKSWEDAEPLDRKSGLGPRMRGEAQVKGMSPMLLCGLALAGANAPENGLGRTPGLITADELSTLDLSKCELAVLSACDTNVGERRAGQGVASLQKALHIAGARSVITSLWKVPDEATKELMLDFYRRLWVEKKPKWQALWEAKRKLRDAKGADGRPLYATRDWAAWVLTGEPD